MKIPDMNLMQQKIITNRVHDGGYKDFTYQQLKEILDTLSPEQLAQQVQIIPELAGVTPAPIRLHPVIAAGTVKELLCDDEGKPDNKIHSSVDFQFHPEEFVLLTDGSPYGEHGDTFYTMEKRNGKTVMVGNVSGIVKDFCGKVCEPDAE